MKNVSLYIKDICFNCMVAMTEEEQRLGLMYIKSNPPNMIFPYLKPKYNSFWMKNTYVPLDIIFCLNGKIKLIEFGEPLSTKAVGNCLSDLIIELPYGTCSRNDIKEGDVINLEHM